MGERVKESAFSQSVANQPVRDVQEVSMIEILGKSLVNSEFVGLSLSGCIVV